MDERPYNIYMYECTYIYLIESSTLCVPMWVVKISEVSKGTSTNGQSFSELQIKL